MHSLFAPILLGASLSGFVLGAPALSFTAIEGTPTSFPALTDKSKLPALQQLAHGSLPNSPAPPPGAISAEGITNLQLIELNEFFEAAFFSSMLANITDNVPGFVINDQDERNYLIDSLVAIIAQEELHGINADNALRSQKADTIQPCKYKFPSTTFEEAVEFAATFTDVVLGTLQDVIQVFSINKDNGLTRGVASVVGQEGQQSAFYRILQNKNKVPSELPFLTTSTRDFAFSSLEQGVLVSCPNDDILKKKLKIFGVLNLVTKNIQPVDQNLQFSFDIQSLLKSNIISSTSGDPKAYGNTYNAGYKWDQVSVVYINQQNTPIVEKLQNIKVSGSVVTFDATFPFTANLLNGLTIAAVTKSSGPFANASQVADASLFGPAFIEVN